MAEAVDPALRELSPVLREMVRCDWLLGVDPGFVGLHAYDKCGSGDGRTYADTPHCAWAAPFHLRKGEPTTVILPKIGDLADRLGGISRAQCVLEHEHWHVIDFEVYLRTGKWIAEWVDLPVVSDYAARNMHERFACAGQCSLYPPRTDWGQVLGRDTRRFFEAFSERGCAVFEAV